MQKAHMIPLVFLFFFSPAAGGRERRHTGAGAGKGMLVCSQLSNQLQNTRSRTKHV